MVRLRMPTLLAATAIGLAPACPENGDDDTAASEGSAETGELPSCMIADEGECEAADGCAWSPQVDFCVIDCAPLEDAETCETAQFCEWSEDHCEHHAT